MPLAGFRQTFLEGTILPAARGGGPLRRGSALSTLESLGSFLRYQGYYPAAPVQSFGKMTVSFERIFRNFSVLKTKENTANTEDAVAPNKRNKQQSTPSLRKC